MTKLLFDDTGCTRLFDLILSTNIKNHLVTISAITGFKKVDKWVGDGIKRSIWVAVHLKARDL